MLRERQLSSRHTDLLIERYGEEGMFTAALEFSRSGRKPKGLRSQRDLAIEWGVHHTRIAQLENEALDGLGKAIAFMRMVPSIHSRDIVDEVFGLLRRDLCTGGSGVRSLLDRIDADAFLSPREKLFLSELVRDGTDSLTGPGAGICTDPFK